MRRLLFVVGALFLLCADANCLTLSGARTEVRRLVRDSPASGLYRYSDTVLNSLLNQSQREVVNATWCLENSYSFSLVTGTTYYSLPSDLIAVKLVSFKDSTGKKRELNETSYKAVRQNNYDYERMTGPPTQYAIRASTHSAGTSDEILPIPVATASQLGTVIIDYYSTPTDLSSDSTVFLDGQTDLIQYHEGIVYETVAKIKLIEGDPSAQTFMQMYQTEINIMNSRSGEKPNLTPGFSGGSGSSSSPSR